MINVLIRHFRSNILIWSLVGILILYCFGIYMIMPKAQSDLSPANWKKLSQDHKLFFMIIEYANSNLPNAQEYLEELGGHNISEGHQVINLSITEKPKWPWHYHYSESSEQIRKHILSKNIRWLEASYQLSDGKWLNYAKSEQYTYFHYAIAFILLLLLLGLVISYSAVWGLHRHSLGNIKRSAQRLGVDMYSSLDASKGTPLLQDTLSVLKSMQNRIQRLVNRNSQVTAAIAHDLRTPITRVRLSLEFFDAGEHEHKITKNLSEMEQMITELIHFSKSSTYREPKHLIDLNAILRNCCFSFQDVGKSIDFNAVKGKVPLMGAGQSFQRCFNNIINNAFKFGDHVEVSSQVMKNQVIITIADNGPGIPETEIDKVLQPFYRTEFGLESGKSGSGLGLAIVAEVVAYHMGGIRLYNRPQGGLAVELIFSIA